MLKLILTLIETNNIDLPRLINLLKVVQNGTIHLQNVINDALDITRLENNKFEIHLEPFKIREALQDVYDIMKLQVDQKNLEFSLSVHDHVPEIVVLD
jgi:signal transduction histidine kinase